jgi:hypothetical protein
MAHKNENIHFFIIKQEYARNGLRQNFSTTACALEDIFGANFKAKSLGKKD